MSTTVKTYVVVNKSFSHRIVSAGWSFALLFGGIGLGVWLESAAMQWAGAIVFFLGMFAQGTGRYKEMTRDEAIKFLQEMED